MALVVGDIHGDLRKLESFLAFKPEEEHISVGDICDDWTATDLQINECIKLAFKKSSNLTNILGNHDLQYCGFNSPFYCSGFRSHATTTSELIQKKLKNFYLAIFRDGYAITHSGIDAYFSEKLATKDPETIVNYLESEWRDWLESKSKDKSKDIFAISRISGGKADFGGPLWARPKFDAIDQDYSQVFGHTERPSEKIEYFNPETNVGHYNVDTKRYVCFNTQTGNYEDFPALEKKK